MTYTNETGGILKEENKKRRGASRAMSIGATEPQPSPTILSEPATSCINWVTLLQTRLTDCPTDTLTRCALASLLEELGQPEEALCHWNAVGLRSRQSESSSGGGSMSTTNRATSAVRSVRKLMSAIRRSLEPLDRVWPCPGRSSSRLPFPAGGNSGK